MLAFTKALCTDVDYIFYWPHTLSQLLPPCTEALSAEGWGAVPGKPGRLAPAGKLPLSAICSNKSTKNNACNKSSRDF